MCAPPQLRKRQVRQFHRASAPRAQCVLGRSGLSLTQLSTGPGPAPRIPGVHGSNHSARHDFLTTQSQTTSSPQRGDDAEVPAVPCEAWQQSPRALFYLVNKPERGSQSPRWQPPGSVRLSGCPWGCKYFCEGEGTFSSPPQMHPLTATASASLAMESYPLLMGSLRRTVTEIGSQLQQHF